MSIRIFYVLKGRRFNYDQEIKATLKAFATDQGSVDDMLGQRPPIIVLMTKIELRIG